MTTKLDEHRTRESALLKRLGRIGGNIASMFASDVINRASTFLVYAMVGRYLGTLAFGQLSVALVMFQSGQLLAIAGLQTLLTREVAKSKSETDRYVTNGTFIVLMFSIVTILGLWGVVALVGYSQETSSAILLLAVSLIPYALGVITDAIFQAWERMHYIASGNLIANTVKVGLAFFFLTQGYPLFYVILAIFIAHTLNLIIKWYWLLKKIVRPKLSVDISFSIKLVKDTATFFAIRGSKAVLNGIDIIILSKLTGEIEVGLITAAFQIMVPIGLVFQSTVLGVFPVMCKNYDGSYKRLRLIAEQLLEILLLIVIPTTIGIFFLADSILLLLYGNEDFAAAVPLLQAVVWILILRVFTQVLGMSLIASMQEKKTLQIFLIDSLATILIAPILIYFFGVFGAAWASLAVRGVDFIQHYVPVKRMFGGLAMVKVMWKPVVSSILMSAVLISMPDQNFVIKILAGGLTYTVVLIPLTLWEAGSFENLKLMYVQRWMEETGAFEKSA
ncbi:MAG: flippase [Chloroflexota bacterium]